MDDSALLATRLRRPNLKGAVADRIREFILSGVLKPNEKIDQDEIAQQLDVSKLPVREALISLEAEGLVRTVPRRGAFVARISRQDVHDHYAIYGMLSGLAAARAAEALSDDELEKLADLVRQLKSSTSAEQQEAANFAFHRIINRAGGSRRLMSVLRMLNNGIPTHFFVFNPGWSEIAYRHHLHILEALTEHDGEKAREEMERHLQESADYAVDILEQRGFWHDDDVGTG